MSQVFSATHDLYRWIMSKADPRSQNYPFMQSPFPVLSVIVAYVYFVKVFGPNYMKSRPPFRIEGLIIAYNILMVILSTYFFIDGGRMTYFSGYNFFCEPVNYSSTGEPARLVSVSWWFMILKFAELLDTVFFVLRKKFSQISALHVIHHSLVLWGVWVGIKFGAGGHNAFFPFINCFVHMIMYTYYCLAALGPEVRKYLWWKKYLTIVQMVQFVVAFVHACLPLYIDCGYQPVFAYILIVHAILFLVMFYNFYRKTYQPAQEKETPKVHLKSS